MDFDRIRPVLDRMLDLMREHALAELELESDGMRVRLRKAGAAGSPGEAAGTHPAGPAAADREPVATVVNAPVVGTFYRAGAPDAAPFVAVGDRVESGDVLCVIEAMKLMNDIKADFAGEVVDILAENGQAVEYGQPLFAILPASGG
jgi:oxaloacetate decarboxylase alpha subunit